jgi:hypothetical protein
MHPEIVENELERHVRKGAAIVQILHVAPPGAIKLLKQRIVPPIEFENAYAETVTEGSIEGGCGLDPAAVDIEIGVRVPPEDVGAEQLMESGRRHVIANVGIADPRRHPGRPRHRSQH